MFKKILFATDIGPYTPLALVHVESLARHYGAQISLVHAVPPMSEYTNTIVKSYCSDEVKREALKTGNIKGMIESVRDEIFDMITGNPLLEGAIMDLIDDIVIVPGKPAHIILFEADRLQADLIVIGSHGAEGLSDGILGSVATKVLQLAKVPVFLVPMSDARSMLSPNESNSSSLRARRSQ